MFTERYELLQKQPQLICLSSKPGGHTVYMFRDDPEDFCFGGNKVRFYEFLIPDILKEKPDILLTSGSLYSNHVRVTAAVAARLGIECRILLTEDSCPEQLPGSLRLAQEYGAKFEFIGSFAALVKTQEYIDGLTAEGRKVFFVPNGGHTPGAVRAYARAAVQALEMFDSMSVQPARIFLPCASGTTLSGLICGAVYRPLPPITAFAVSNTPAKAVKGVRRLIGQAAGYLPEGFVPGEISVLDCGKNDYGHPDAELLALRSSLMDSDGIRLDPTYNINAFYGMTEFLKEQPGTEPVLYINTGGYTELG